MIVANIVREFQPGQFRIWPLVPIAAVVIIAFGLLLSGLLFIRELPKKKNMLSLASIQNASFLILPIGSVLFPDQFEEFKLYCFLYLLGVSPVLWTLGKYLVSTEPGTGIKVRDFITPPFVANLIGLFLVFTNLRQVVPSIIIGSAELIGSATVPVATLVLGAVLGGMSFRLRPHLFDALRVATVKMIVIPLATVAALHFTTLASAYPLLAIFLVIEAASAPATTMVIQVKHYGGDEQKIGSIILLTYIACTFTLPFWVALWQSLNA
jgi:predicted permease